MKFEMTPDNRRLLDLAATTYLHHEDDNTDENRPYTIGEINHGVSFETGRLVSVIVTLCTENEDAPPCFHSVLWDDVVTGDLDDEGVLVKIRPLELSLTPFPNSVRSGDVTWL